MPLTVSLCDRGPPPPCPARFNIARHALFSDQPSDRTALTILGEGGGVRDHWTYGGLRDAVARAAGALRAAGLRPGERVMLRMGGSADFPIVFLGVVAAGGVAAPTSAQLTPTEAAYLAADMGARFVCLGEGFDIDAPGAAILGPADLRDGPMLDPVDTAADDPAFIVYTSGSSGRPKGVVHAQRSAWARRMMWRGWYGLGPDDLMLHAGALNWTYTLGAGLLDPWGAGAATLVYGGPRDPAVWATIAARHRPTLFAAAPGVHRQLLKHGERLDAAFAALRHALSAGEKLPDATADDWTMRTGKPIYEALGMSEISTYVSSSPEAPPRRGFVGPPQPGRRVAILRRGGSEPAPVGEVGELAVCASDPGLMLGYHGAGLPLRDGWFVTGDLAAMDADGYVAYRGRADDLMNAGGYRVSPQEVEDALLAHPGVAEAAVVERTVREGVSIIEAHVVAPGLDAPALESWCAGRLAAYKRPRAYVFAEALPRTATGKVIRRALTR